MTNNIQTIKLNTGLIPLFSGTYNTIWEIQETDEQGNELTTKYDFKDFMKGIASVYKNKEDYILSELNVSFIKNIKFTGTFYSPREYNFSTDTLDFTIDIDKTEMLAELSNLRNDKDFETYLYDNFTDQSGFISFTPNNYASLYIAIMQENDEYHQAISALITYLAKDVINQEYNFEYTIYDHWQGNGYGGTDYDTVCEWCDKHIDYDNDYKCTNIDCEKYEE